MWCVLFRTASKIAAPRYWNRGLLTRRAMSTEETLSTVGTPPLSSCLEHVTVAALPSGPLLEAAQDPVCNLLGPGSVAQSTESNSGMTMCVKEASGQMESKTEVADGLSIQAGHRADGEIVDPNHLKNSEGPGEGDASTCGVEVIPRGMTAEEFGKMSLKQRKKALKWEQAKLRRKEKDKKRKEQKKLERKERVEAKKDNEEGVSTEPKAKRKKMSDKGASELRVVIDLCYQNLMNEKDQKKIMHQCQRCYSVNRRAECPLQLYFTSFTEKTVSMWDKQHLGYQKWDVHRKEEGFIELFERDSVVFLTSDSPNILTDLDPAKVYIIGGLVDHNHHKGYCYQRALDLGVAHAQLPISQYVKLNCRTVLAVNHVFEILLQYLSCKDWEEAFHKVIPPRKVVGSPPPSSSSAATSQTETPSDHQLQQTGEATDPPSSTSGGDYLPLDTALPTSHQQPAPPTSRLETTTPTSSSSSSTTVAGTSPTHDLQPELGR